MIKDKALIVLHVAAISDNFICGPSYSVPGLVESLCACGVQCALLSSSHVGLYTKPVPFTIFHGYRLGFRSLDSLDAPFRRPDLICLHSTYILPHALISFQASTRGIPYLITPRGGMR